MTERLGPPELLTLSRRHWLQAGVACPLGLGLGGLGLGGLGLGGWLPGLSRVLAAPSAAAPSAPARP